MAVSIWTGDAGDCDMNNPANWQGSNLPRGGDLLCLPSGVRFKMSKTTTEIDDETVEYLSSPAGILHAAHETLGDEWDGIDLRPEEQPIIR